MREEAQTPRKKDPITIAEKIETLIVGRNQYKIRARRLPTVPGAMGENPE